MTPELKKELIIGIVSALATALFTGIPAVALFWWTWRRDQERLRVQKLFPHGRTLSGDRVRVRDNFGPVVGIVIRNLSLFPVHVSSVGFDIDGEVVELEQAYFPLKMIPNPDKTSNYPSIADPSADPYEVPCGKSIAVNVMGVADRSRLSNLLKAAAERHKQTEDELLGSSKVVALVALETGKVFSSMPYWKRLWRKALEMKTAMDRPAEPE
jgi:hypothetical protein